MPRAAVLVVSLSAALFALFPLTDTDIWWHLACAREWVTPWTPVREPVVNVHEYFQWLVGIVYDLGGAPFLVTFKSLLWGLVFALFLWKAPLTKFWTVACVVAIFIFRYQLEVRPVVVSLLFLGIYWNFIPWLAQGSIKPWKKWGAAFGFLTLQWIWCKCQGLFILGPIFTLGVFAFYFDKRKLKTCTFALEILFVLGMFMMPLLHKEGLLLAAYPFELLNRLLGLEPSAAIFAREIAENRSPVILFVEGENFWTSLLMLLCVGASLAGVIIGLFRMICTKVIPEIKILWAWTVLLTTSLLALMAERNFVLFLPVFLSCLGLQKNPYLKGFGKFEKWGTFLVLAFVLGLWGRSLKPYDRTMVSYQRVPVAAAKWMKSHPHSGRLFNDDRAGGYLALMNPGDSIYIDGRFMLKTAEFFGRYLDYAQKPNLFFEDADSLGIDRAIFPLRYYARWGTLLQALNQNENWDIVYKDEFFVVFQNDDLQWN